MVRRAKALEADDWERLERRPRYTFRERGYVNKLNYEDVAEYDYQPTNAARPTGWSWCAPASLTLLETSS